MVSATSPAARLGCHGAMAITKQTLGSMLLLSPCRQIDHVRIVASGLFAA